MDGLDDLVKEACRLVRAQKFIAAQIRLHDVADKARHLPHGQAKTLGPRLYAFLTWVGDAVEAHLAGNGIDDAVAGEFSVGTDITSFVDRFEAHFTDMLEAACSSPRAESPLVERAKQYIEAGVRSGRRTTIKSVTKRLHCRGGTLRAAWRRSENDNGLTATPSAYLQRCRVEAAKPILLSRPSRPISDVAVDVGCNARTLERAFKTFEGMTPSEYRRRHRPR